MDEFLMDDWMLTKVKRPIYEPLEPHVNAPEPRQQLPPVLTISPWRIDRHEILQITSAIKQGLS